MCMIPIGLASDDVTKLSNAWQREKLVLNKVSAPYKSMLGEKSLTWRSSLFLRGEVRTVFTTTSQLSASHFKRFWGSDKCGAVFQSIDDLPACFCMGRYLCLEPILPVATPVAGLWRSTCKPYLVQCKLWIIEYSLLQVKHWLTFIWEEGLWEVDPVVYLANAFDSCRRGDEVLLGSSQTKAFRVSSSCAGSVHSAATHTPASRSCK